MNKGCMNKTKLSLAIYFLIAFLFLSSFAAHTQTSLATINFLSYQRSFPKISDMMKRKEDTLMKQFLQKGLIWPAKYVYLRSFKYDSEIEMWVKNKKEEK